MRGQVILLIFALWLMAFAAAPLATLIVTALFLLWRSK